MPSVRTKKTSAKKLASALSLDDLDKQYNVNVIIPARIRAALEKLGDNAMTAMNFQQAANVTTVQLNQFSEMFDKFLVVVRDGGKPKTLWCGNEAFARKVRERLGI